MKLTSTMPSWAQWVLAVFITLICIGTGLISMAMNVRFGLQFSPIMGGLLGLSDVLKISLPAVAIILGWQWQTKALYYGAAIFSVFCALNYLAETQGNTLLEGKHRTLVIENAKAEIESAKAERDAIDELLGSEDLKTLYNAKIEAVSRETGRGGCGPKCESLQREADALMARYSQAQRRDEIDAKIAEASALLKATPEKTIGSVGIISVLTGISKETVGMGFTIIVSLFVLFLLELAAMLSGNAMKLLRGAYGAGKKKPGRAVPTSKGVVTAEEPEKMTKDVALEKVQLKIFHSPGQMLICSRRALADELGVAKSTFNDWCNTWEAEGEVITKKRGNNTEFKAAKEAA